jgi:hypothetical protein
LLATQLARRFATAHRDVGLSLARYLLEQWLPAKRVSLRPSTWDGYRRKIELHVVPRIGHVPLRRLRVERRVHVLRTLIGRSR